MGWDISESGFRIVLSAEVPEVVRRHLRGDVDAFLADHGLTRSDIRSWISHPGGPKVLEAMQEALELPDDALESAWRTLREVGNLSSTSVLLVLEETLRAEDARAGNVRSDARHGAGLLLRARAAPVVTVISNGRWLRMEDETVAEWIDSRVLYTGLVALVAVMRLCRVGRVAAQRRSSEGARRRRGRSRRSTRGWWRSTPGFWWPASPRSGFSIVPSSRGSRRSASVSWSAPPPCVVWVMATLGERWSTRVLILPETEPVTSGPFRQLRHPNYLAVVVEFAALPMVHTAWLTAVVFSVAERRSCSAGGSEPRRRP